MMSDFFMTGFWKRHGAYSRAISVMGRVFYHLADEDIATREGRFQNIRQALELYFPIYRDGYQEYMDAVIEYIRPFVHDEPTILIFIRYRGCWTFY